MFPISCKRYALAVTSAIALSLTACGGGGGGDINSIPTPPTSPTPTPTPTSASVTIFPNPLVQTYESMGASASGSFAGSTPLGTISSKAADQPQIRFAGGGYYEIQMPGRNWEALIPHSGISPPSQNEFQPQSSDTSYFIIQQAAQDGYKYSELASWSEAGRFGSVAFGAPTLPGQVPTTGSAHYAGDVIGSSDVINSNSFDGPYHVPVAGSVSLDFNFASGTLGGSMTLKLNDYSPAPIGTFAFKNTVFGVGSPNYSGKFDTSLTGQNYFLGQFTGPNAEETIGAWALPFSFTQGSSTLTPDGKTHQAFGAFIAKH